MGTTITWKAAEQSVPPIGYDKPQVVYQYFAYKDGKAIKCHTLDDAKRISKNYEQVVTTESFENMLAYGNLHSQRTLQVYGRSW